MSKEYELFIYWLLKDLQKLRQKLEKITDNGLREEFNDYLLNQEIHLRHCFGDNEKLDYLLSLNENEKGCAK